MSSFQSAVVRKHFEQTQSQHNAGNQRKSKEEAGTCAETAFADESCSAGHGSEFAVQGCKVEGSEPAIGIGHFVEDTGKEADGKEK